MNKEEIRSAAGRHKAAIKKRGMSQRFVAAGTGLHESVLSAYLSGNEARMTYGNYSKVESFLIGG